ncbi:hypothetical protein DVF07_23955, partial [Salmonella enterica subsp. enterica serovar Miami]|nr:hypothetical protein [Salmonella enterica subsp. enterica serovar Miami]
EFSLLTEALYRAEKLLSVALLKKLAVSANVMEWAARISLALATGIFGRGTDDQSVQPLRYLHSDAVG